jgi:hypothetical protein
MTSIGIKKRTRIGLWNIRTMLEGVKKTWEENKTDAKNTVRWRILVEYSAIK